MVGFVPQLSAATEGLVARGVVFNDLNKNGIRDANEKGLRGVCVSNGSLVVQTDAEGRYELPVEGDETCLFVIKPTNWTPPLNENNIMQFHYFHKPEGSQGLKVPGLPPSGDLPDSIDFPLSQQREPTRFKVLMLGDPQTTNFQQVAFYAHDVLAELVGTDAAFGVALGDIVNDRPLMFEDNVAAVSTVGIPWHHVFGNHDRNFDAPDYASYDDTYNRVVGPSHYSFNWGGVHFVVLNNIHSLGGHSYEGRLTQEQLDFLKSDLAFVPEKQLVVLMSHIPLNETKNREDLFRLIEQRPHTFSISAHNHVIKHFFFDEKQGWRGAKPHHHFVCPTSCGSWWSGVPDEVGIPHAMMGDGAPNGYVTATFDGNEYSFEFKAARFPADYQMNIFAPSELPLTEAATTEVVVNVFIGSRRSQVEMRVGEQDEWRPMAQFAGHDPYFRQLKDMEEKHALPGSKLPAPNRTEHLWKATLPESIKPGVHLIRVRTVDLFGHRYEASRAVFVR